MRSDKAIEAAIPDTDTAVEYLRRVGFKVMFLAVGHDGVPQWLVDATTQYNSVELRECAINVMLQLDLIKGEFAS